MFDNINEHIAPSVLTAITDVCKHVSFSSLRLLRIPLNEFKFTNFYLSNSEHKIEVCYHGTSSKVLDSINTLGMLDPDSELYNVANGNVYGAGVYMSPRFDFARGYAKNNGCILVTLVVRGTTTPETGKMVLGKHPLMHDYQQPCGDILVLRSSIQVLPILVVNAKFNKPDSYIPVEPLEVLHTNVKLDNVLMSVAESIKPTDVKIGVVYNLLARGRIIKPRATIDEVTQAVVETLDMFDYSGY